jgi:hypothetical protein
MDITSAKLAPFTDLDSDPGELSIKWESAKFAFVTIMKTWVGIFYLTADELALPLLVKMLNDAKVFCSSFANGSYFTNSLIDSFFKPRNSSRLFCGCAASDNI